MESKKTIAWWRYPAAVILLAMCSIFLPVVISVIMGLMQIITPRFFQSGFGWIILVADVAGVATDSDLFGCIGVLGAAVTSFVFVGIYCKKNAKQQTPTHKEESP